MAKNCHTCKHLWRDSDEHRAEWVCEKRQDNPQTVKAEQTMIDNMKRDAYRNLYKRCFEQQGQSSSREAAERSGK